MIHELAYTLVWGKPLVMWTGLLTFLLFLATATFGALFYHHSKWVKKLPFAVHPIFAITALLLAFAHGLMGLSIYFNF